MTDKDSLFLYRLKQAEETLLDAENMLKGNFTPRSITNTLHDIFDARLEFDYKEFTILSEDTAAEHIKLAVDFLKIIKDFIDKNTTQ